uniref:Uncharacterized protein n=1 Tax=Brassica oleracea var. oleracea TaxID=109376 RepID=A0A0D3A0G6_BRAOL
MSGGKLHLKLSMRSMFQSLGMCSRKNCGLGLDLLQQRTLTRPYLRSDRQERCENSNVSSSDYRTRSRAGLRRRSLGLISEASTITSRMASVCSNQKPSRQQLSWLE